MDALLIHADYKRFTVFGRLDPAPLQRNATLLKEFEPPLALPEAPYRSRRLQMLAVVPVSVPPSQLWLSSCPLQREHRLSRQLWANVEAGFQRSVLAAGTKREKASGWHFEPSRAVWRVEILRVNATRAGREWKRNRLQMMDLSSLFSLSFSTPFFIFFNWEWCVEASLANANYLISICKAFKAGCIRHYSWHATKYMHVK